MLLPYTPDEPIFFGLRMNPVLPQGYMSDNAGRTNLLIMDELKLQLKIKTACFCIKHDLSVLSALICLMLLMNRLLECCIEKLTCYIF